MAKDLKDEPAAGDDTSGDVANPGSVDAARVSRFRSKGFLIGASILVAVIAYSGYRWIESTETKVQSEAVEPSPQEKFDQIRERLANDKETTLQVDDFEITDSMLLQIKDLEKLETVIVDQGRITDEGIVHLPTLPNLQLVRLRYSPITDAGMATLAKCSSLWYRSLRGVHLIDIPVTNDGLKSLASLPYLESLYLDNSLVTESGWRWLYTNYPQIHVHVNQKHHDYDPKAHAHHD